MKIKSSKLFKIIAIAICFFMVFEQSGFAQIAGELDLSSHFLALRNSFIQDRFRPLHLRYLSYDPSVNNFNLLLDKGDFVKGLSPKGTDPKESLQQETKTLLNYFFIGISLPNEAFWVNLRPDAEDNIIDSELGETDVGKILLEADLQLKKDTANFTSPQTLEGKDYWDKLYKKAEELYGSENITIPTLTRPWIVPDEIIIRESSDNAYIYKATLKVMLEQDYLKDSSTYNFKDERSKALNEYSSQLIRETIIPKLTKEINSSKRYAPLRQVYYSLILAQWFKQKFYGKSGVYPYLIDRHNLTGLTSKTSWSKTTYFNAYKASFQQGEYNIKEPRYTPYGQTIRSYMSGGIALASVSSAITQGLVLRRDAKALIRPYGLGFKFKGGIVSNPFDGETELASSAVEQPPAASSSATLQSKSTSFPLGTIGIEIEAVFKNDLINIAGLKERIKGLEQEKKAREQRIAILIKQREQADFISKTKIEEIQGNIEKEKQILRDEKNKPWLIWFKSWGMRKDTKQNITRMQSEIDTLQLQLENKKQEIANEINQLNSRTESLQNEMDDKCVEYLDKIKSIITGVLAKYTRAEESLVNNDSLYAELNEELIDKKIMPGLRELERKGNITPEQAKEYLALAREQLREGIAAIYSGWGGSQEESDRVRQRNNRLDELNRECSFKLSELGGQIGLQRGDQDKAYGRITDLLIRQHAHELLLSFINALEAENLPISLVNQVKEIIRDTLGQSEAKQNTMRKEFIRIGSGNITANVERHISEHRENLPLDISLMPKAILKDHFINESFKQRWSTFKANPKIKSMFGDYTFDALERTLAKRTVNDLLEEKEHTNESIDLGYRLFWLAEESPGLKVELAPLIIMNSWREPGYSGEYPFLPGRVTYFILSLTESERITLKQKNIPGLIEIIETVRTHPNTYSALMIDNPEWKRLKEAFEKRYFSPNIDKFDELMFAYQEGREETIWEIGRRDTVLSLREAIESACKDIGMQPGIVKDRTMSASLVDNPIYKQIKQNLAEMCITFLRERDGRGGYNEAKQFFVMALLERLKDVNLSLGYAIMEDILRTSRNHRLQAELLDMVVFKSRYFDDPNNFAAVEVVLRSFTHVPDYLQEKIRALAPQMFLATIEKEGIADSEISLFIPALGDDYFPPHASTRQKIQALKKTISFLKRVRDIYETGYGGFYDPEYLKQYIMLANRDEIVQCIEDLRPLGYLFSIEHYKILPGIYEQKADIISALYEIKKISPDFQYHLFYEIENNKDSPRGYDRIFIIDPYENLMRFYANRNEGLRPFFYHLYTIQQAQGFLSQALTNGILKWLGSTDYQLKARWDYRTADEKHHVLFNKAVQMLLMNLFEPNGKLYVHQDFYLDKAVLAYLARRPDKINEIVSLSEYAPNLFSLLQVGGPLHENRMLIMQDIFSNDNAVARAQVIESIFTKPTAYWQQLFLFAETRLGSQLRSAASEYPLTEIAFEDGTVVPLTDIVAEHIAAKQNNPNTKTRLEGIVVNQSLITQLESGQIHSIPFSELETDYKPWIFRHYLKQTIETSQDEKSKAEADARNRQVVIKKLSLQDGDYLHGSTVDVLESVLRNGNLPREALGEGATTDSYPFHVDFTRLTRDFIGLHQETERIITASLSNGYGGRGLLGSDGQLWYVYHRGKGCWEEGKEYGPSSHHSLLLGGMPATEIASIVLRSPDKTLEKVKRAIVENGFYIPLYNLQGTLLFSADEYDSIRSNFNYSVPVEVWDYSLKTGEQKGSNPGAEFTVPTDSGPSPYYVKFAQHEEESHIWVEDLANKLYRVLGIPVPETKIVKVAGNYGHASRILPLDMTATLEAHKQLVIHGFLADTLMANWDIPYAIDRNTLISGGLLYRIDNGGALLFRARGQRKDKDLFGPQAPVRELERGDNFERLGYGMRQAYEAYGLTPKDIIEQGAVLKTRLTDDAINTLVDSIRMSRVDRTYLQDTLKHRRDYILSWIKNNYGEVIAGRMQQQSAGSPVAGKPASSPVSGLTIAKEDGSIWLNIRLFESMLKEAAGSDAVLVGSARYLADESGLVPLDSIRDIDIAVPWAKRGEEFGFKRELSDKIKQSVSSMGISGLADNMDINIQVVNWLHSSGQREQVILNQIAILKTDLNSLIDVTKNPEGAYYSRLIKLYLSLEYYWGNDARYVKNRRAFFSCQNDEQIKDLYENIINPVNGDFWRLKEKVGSLNDGQKYNYTEKRIYGESAGSPVATQDRSASLEQQLGQDVAIAANDNEIEISLLGELSGKQYDQALALIRPSTGGKLYFGVVNNSVAVYTHIRQEGEILKLEYIERKKKEVRSLRESGINNIPANFIQAVVKKEIEERGKPFSDIYTSPVVTGAGGRFAPHFDGYEDPTKEIIDGGERWHWRRINGATLEQYDAVYDKTKTASPLEENVGGIDMRSLSKNTVIQPMAASKALKQGLSPKGPVPVSDKEWQEIERMANSGIAPSCERLREYLLSLQDPNSQVDKVLACIADILRQEEEKACYTESSLREILVLLESDKPVNELRLALAKVQVLAKEPQLIAQ
ncbi:MAG: hypothetical protein WC616_00260 [Candidatus Omnitrophota bacterium]